VSGDENAMTKRTPEKRYWLDDSRNVDRIVWALYGICALLLVIDLLVPKHGPFQIEHLFGFYGFFGLIACVGLVLAAKMLRVILMRPEDYYDR
jgi:uncharacterized membrane protein